MGKDTYITFKELPNQRGAKTRRWYVLDKGGVPFAIIKWYGGWRKYVCYFQADSWCDHHCLREIADFCQNHTAGHLKAKKEIAQSAQTDIL